MEPNEKVAAEQLKDIDDVRQALDRATTQRDVAPKTAGTNTLMITAYGAAFVVLLWIYFATIYHLVEVPARANPWVHRVALGGAATALVLALARGVDLFVVSRVRSTATRYNLERVLKLVAWLLLGLIVVSVIFVNWYTAVVSVGLISLILGFALQTPITSFIGWIYILVRAPYRVGDRIQVGNATGDVIDVSYLDTTLWEFGGHYVSTDHPSGRVIKFPNSNILSAPVYNYSWPLFPYIWNEITFHIGYGADLEFVARTMEEIVVDELGEEMMSRVRVFRELLAETPVDELQVRERPAVFFRVNDNTWLEATVRYLVHPRQQGRIKTRLIKRLLERMNREPDRVQFPRGDRR